jgi:phospholipid/cholesterol/gamma-HCH transport system ATP-binding protein
MDPDCEVEAKEESRTGKVQEKDSEIKKIAEKADKGRPMDVPLIEFKDVTKRFGPRTILERVNLQIYEEQVTTIIGLSGSGKSVLLKHIVGLLKPDEGTILFRGKPLHRMGKKEMDACLSQMSYMFQGNALFDSMTVYENVAIPIRETVNLSSAEIDRRVMARIEQAELGEAAQKYPSQISGGMQKRAALARALITDPKIVLFDEPTTGLDPVRKNAILSMIAQYRKKFGFTAILVSHEIPDIFFISNRILALYDRTIVFQGSPEELEAFDHPFKDEVLKSIEGLQEELTGLYSRRYFKVRYQNELKREAFREAYVVVVFTIENLDAIRANLGHEAAPEAIRCMGLYIDKYFGAVGGFSTRRNTNEFVTVLPDSNRLEVDGIVDNLTKDFQEQGLGRVQAGTNKSAASRENVEFTIRAGLAQGHQGQSTVELESIIALAKQDQKEIARIHCDAWGKVN